MAHHTFIIVSDKFSEFAHSNGAVTPQQIRAMLLLPDRILPDKVCLRRGQGIADKEIEDLSKLIRDRDPNASRWDISDLLSRPRRASGELSHKRKSCNTLVANPVQTDDQTYMIDLCIDQDCELMDDHQTGQHVQGMILIEASRQAFLVVTEAYFLREQNQKSYFVINSISSEFHNFVFPVHAHLLYRVLSKDINERRQKFSVEIDLIQADKICMTTAFAFTVYPSDVIARKERDLAEETTRSCVGVVPAFDLDLQSVGPLKPGSIADVQPNVSW